MIYTHVLKTRVLSASGARPFRGREHRGRQAGREHGPQHEGGFPHVELCAAFSMLCCRSFTDSPEAGKADPSMTHGGSSRVVEVTRYQRAGRSEGRLAHALNPGARGPSQ